MVNSEENAIETEDNLKWLYANNQVLYKDLYNLLNNTNVGYRELYYCSDIGTTYDGDNYYNFNEYIDDYFLQLENKFTALNSTYDYMIRDISGTEKTISNTGEDTLNVNNYGFYLSFIYDEHGNISIGNQIVSANVDKLRKNSNSIVRNQMTASDIWLEEYFSDSHYADALKEYTKGKALVNCEIIYGIKSGRLEQIVNDSINNELKWQYYSGYVNAGCDYIYSMLLMLIFLGAFFIPMKYIGKPWEHSKVFRLPLEGAGLMLILILSSMNSVITNAVQIGTGSAIQNMLRDGNSREISTILVYGGNLLNLMVLFFATWYLGIYCRAAKEYGIWKYLKKNSLIYRFFPFMKSKIKGVYHTIIHLDITQNANKQIIKILLINAVILFVISSLWFGGFAITIVYSLVLYFILRKMVSDLQKKYSILLYATNEIAEGNLNVSIHEDLGVFEPFKPQIARIQKGFKNAVEEEVKSQRMKTELITNVSHDLKTPLTAIITYISLLQQDNITEEERKEYLKTLEAKSLRLKVLIEDLFEVSKATSKTVNLNIMDVDIVNLIKHVILETSHKFQESNLDIRVQLPESKIILPLDSQKTYRIYENLFINIAKYALPGTRVYVDGYQQEDSVIIILKNITAQEINVSSEELLDRFVRGDEARNTEGSGLGLAIAKSFTELQNGHLSIDIDGDLFKVTTTWKLPK